MNVKSLQYLPFTYLFRSICQYFSVYRVIRVQQQIVTYFKCFEKEVGIIRNKYIKACYPFRSINSEKDCFNQGKEDPLIPTSLVKERKEGSFRPFFSRAVFFPSYFKVWFFLFCFRNNEVFQQRDITFLVFQKYLTFAL